MSAETPGVASDKKQNAEAPIPKTPPPITIPPFEKGGPGGIPGVPGEIWNLEGIQLLTNHLEIWTTAETEKKSGRGRTSGNGTSVYGIKKLRGLIYELAAMGRIVDHEENAKEYPLGEISNFIMGQAPPGNECNTYGEGIVFVKTGEFGSLFPEIKEWTTKPLKFAKKGDVLICVVGATIGKLNLAIDCAIGRSVAAIRPNEGIDTKYLYFSLIPFTLRLREKSRGSAQGVIGKVELASVMIRVPSINEQKQIVTKVDELMALCDQLETQHNNAAAAHEQLVNHLLGTLTRSQSADDFSANWQRIAAHFDTLFTTEASIDALKQTLLQLAVMGKLVPQYPNDEPASELLKRIQAEKAKGVAEGKIKKDKPLPPISDEEKPFELPRGWEWVRLQSVVDVRDGTHDSPKEAEGEIASYPLVTSKDFFEGGINFDTARRISEADHLEISKRSLVEKYDILFSMIGGNIGNQVMVRDDRPFSVKNVALFKYYDRNLTFPFFIKKYMENLAVSLQSSAIGGAQPFITLGTLRNLVMALPPLLEQHRIVAKVDELMTLCDQLKTRITESNQCQLKLADVMVEHTISL